MSKRRNPYYLCTDAELGAELGKLRIAMMFKKPVTSMHLRCIDEAARRLSTLVRLANDNGECKPVAANGGKQ